MVLVRPIARAVSVAVRLLITLPLLILNLRLYFPPASAYGPDRLGPDVVALTAYGWRRCQLEAVVARLTFP